MKMNFLNKSYFILLIFFLILPLSEATGITPAYYKITFKPNLQQSFFFRGYGDGMEELDIRISGGELAKYVTLHRLNKNEFIVSLKLPEFLEPGIHKIRVGVVPKVSPRESGIGAIAAVRAPIIIFVPYPGKYVKARFSATNANVNEFVIFTIYAKNLGKETVQMAYANIDVFDPENVKVINVKTNEASIKSQEEVILKARFNASGLKDGIYKANADLYWDGNVTKLTTSFKIGNLYVKVVNYTKILEPDKINRFDIGIESRWNTPIKSIYGKVTINKTTAITPTTQLKPWEKKIITTYIDTKHIAVGEHPVEIVLYYENVTTTEIGKVNVIIPEKPAPKMSVTLLVIAVILLIIGNIILVWHMRKRK